MSLADYYERRTAEVWYESFCETWGDLTGGAEPPPKWDFDGETMGYRSDAIAEDLVAETESRVLDAIAVELRQPEWDNQTIERVADLVRQVRGIR